MGWVPHAVGGDCAHVPTHCPFTHLPPACALLPATAHATTSPATAACLPAPPASHCPLPACHATPCNLNSYIPDCHVHTVRDGCDAVDSATPVLTISCLLVLDVRRSVTGYSVLVFDTCCRLPAIPWRLMTPAVRPLPAAWFATVLFTNTTGSFILTYRWLDRCLLMLALMVTMPDLLTTLAWRLTCYRW